MKLFSDDLLEDARDPVLSFSLPGMEGTFGLFAPRLEFWKQVVVVGVPVLSAQAFCAIFVYHFVVARRNTTQAYLFGWAVVIPFISWLPFQFIEFFEFQNVVIKMAASNMFIAVVPKTIEAMYDTAPPEVESSLANYVEYYISGSHHIRDSKTNQRIPVSRSQLWQAVLRFNMYFYLLSLSTSAMIHFRFSPFESPVVLNNFHFNMDLLHPGHLGNAYCIGVHNFFYIGMLFEFFSLLENLKGWSVKVPFRNPLLASTSPTDFWGRRWNMIIHEVLKGGAFRPARKFFPSKVALLCAFLMSGVIHDFAFACAFYQPHCSRDSGLSSDCYNVPIYKLTLFFLWNAAMMILEKPLGKLPPFTWISTYLPVPIVSTLVLFTALPVSHWFTGDWVVGGAYEALVQAVWIVKKLD